MPNWNDVLNEIKAAGSTHDLIRRKYLKLLNRHTRRNTIIYYSGWLERGELQAQGLSGFEMNDSDMTGFMSAVYGLDRSRGLDLVLHTPGGSFAATEAIVRYLRDMFGTNIRAIIPQIAMSSGTMLALACEEIIMGKHSSLGPIDPQVGGVFPAHGVIEEFERAKAEVQQSQLFIPLWQPIIAKYSPTLIGECEKAIAWSNETVKEWLVTGMFRRRKNRSKLAKEVVKNLGDHALTKSHSRHVSFEQVKKLNLKAMRLEEDSKLQDAVLTLHHACVQTLSAKPVVKLIENHNGIAYVRIAQPMILAQQ